MSTFDESRLADDAQDPLASLQGHDFPWEEIFAALDGDDGLATELDTERLAAALRVLLGWTAEPLKRSNYHSGVQTLAMIGRRALVALWISSPGTLGKDVSLARLGKSLGLHRQVLSQDASAFTQRFRQLNPRQMQGRAGRHEAALRHEQPRDSVPTAAMMDELRSLPNAAPRPAQEDDGHE